MRTRVSALERELRELGGAGEKAARPIPHPLVQISDTGSYHHHSPWIIGFVRLLLI